MVVANVALTERVEVSEQSDPHIKEIRRRAREIGLYNRGVGNYVHLFLIIAALGAIAGFLTLWAPGWWSLGAIPFFVLCWMQVGFIGHDAGHGQISDNPQVNWFFGMGSYPILLGMCWRPWVIRHNLHHSETNDEETDPDLENRLMAFKLAALAGKKGIFLWIVQWQHWLYPFAGMLATFGFRMDAIRYLLKKDGNDKPLYRDERILEAIFIGIWVVSWIIVPTWYLGLRWLWIFIPGQLLFGLHMAMVFAPNHKPMPTFKAGDQIPGYLKRQVETSMDVREEGWLTPIVDFVYGALNLQAEHHAFANVPRIHMQRARLLLIAYCKEVSIVHTEVSVWRAQKLIFGSLKRIAMVARIPEELRPAA